MRATPVADGAGIGAGGFGAYAENACGIEAGQRASACADCVNVEHGDADGESGDFGVAGGGDGAFYQGDVGGSASHVEGDDAFEAAGASAGRGTDYPSGWTGEDRADGFAGGGSQCGDAAAGLHYEDSGTLGRRGG